MGRIVSGLLFIFCLSLSPWAQAPQEQKPAGQAPSPEQQTAKPKSPQAPSAEQGPGDESRTWTATTEFPLDKFKEFSAIMTGGPLPGIESDVHVYRSGNLMRMQGSHPKPDYYVTDLTKQTTHLVSTYSCLKMSTAYVRSFPFFVSAVANKYEVSPAGEETVDGHKCKVLDIKVYRPKTPAVPYFRLYQAEDLDGFPIKIETRRKGGFHWVITYKNVRLEPQDPSLFIYPEKCDSDADWKGPGGAKSKPGAAPSPKPQ